jgi:hypothetical protein
MSLAQGYVTWQPELVNEATSNRFISGSLKFTEGIETHVKYQEEQNREL